MLPVLDTSATLFNSWKEIAAYLGKGVRTVQRWEARLGLPVRRPNHHKKGIVQASRAELDAWLQQQWSLCNRVAALSGEPAPPLSVQTNQGIGQFTPPMGDPELLENVQRSLSKLRLQCRELSSKVQQFRSLQNELSETHSAIRCLHLPGLETNRRPN